mgnify:CR=1 FL=1
MPRGPASQTPQGRAIAGDLGQASRQASRSATALSAISIAMPWPNATTSILTLSAPRSSCALQVLLSVRFRFMGLASLPWKTTRHAVAGPAAAAPERVPSAPGAARASDWVTTAPRDGALLSILSRNRYRRRATRCTRYLNILKPAAGPQSGAHYFCQPHLAKIALPCGDCRNAMNCFACGLAAPCSVNATPVSR